MSYFHPTNESMFCDKGLSCTVQRTYFNVFHLNIKNIKLDANSSIDYITRKYDIPMRSNPPSYRIYFVYDNISPFVYYSFTSSNYNDIYITNRLSMEHKKFLHYIANPEEGYLVKSKANIASLNLSIILYVLFAVFGILYILQDKYEFLDFIFNHKI